MKPIDSSRTFTIMLLFGASLGGACDEAFLDEAADRIDDASFELGSPDVAWRPFAGLTDVAQLELTRNRDGSLALFARTNGGGMRFAKQTSPNAGWVAVTSLGGWGLQDFTVAENLDGRLEVFALGGDGAIYHQWQTAPDSTSWSGWAYLGGHRLRGLAVARHGDGRLQLLALGGDGFVYGKHQAHASASFTDWYWVGGPGLERIAAGAHLSGRLALVGLTPGGELMLTSTPAVNGAFAGWTSLGGHSLRDVKLLRNADGRLEVVALGGDSLLYYKSQVAPDVGWSSWYRLLDAGGVSDLDLALGHDGSLQVFMIGGDRKVHRAAQNGPSGGYVWHAYLGGNDFRRVEAHRNLDGRLEVFALQNGGGVYHTWQTSAGGAWRPLPNRPTIGGLAASPSTAHVGTTISVSWSASPSNGCTLYTRASLLPSGGGSSTLGSWQGQTSGSASFSLQKDTTVRLFAGCQEHRDAGQVEEVTRDVFVKATQPPPQEKTATYRHYLAKEAVWDGPVSYGAWFGYGLNQGKLQTVKNPTLYTISLIAPTASNHDCWGSKSVTLAPGQATTDADISKVYGASRPLLPQYVRGCASLGLNAIEVDVTYTYVQ
jgi:hypothetical protein